MNGIDEIARRVAASLKQRGETVAVAESSSGGLISAALLAVPGASAFFMGGAVVYTRDAKTNLLNIPDALLDEFRSASEPNASILARAARDILGTTWGMAETGAAGPTGNRYGDAAGHVCIAVAGPAEIVRTIETGDSDRAANMRVFAAAALTLLDEALQAMPE
jgi:PncC family amidohydrolase